MSNFYLPREHPSVIVAEEKYRGSTCTYDEAPPESARSRAERESFEEEVFGAALSRIHITEPGTGYSASSRRRREHEPRVVERHFHHRHYADGRHEVDVAVHDGAAVSESPGYSVSQMYRDTLKRVEEAERELNLPPHGSEHASLQMQLAQAEDAAAALRSRTTAALEEAERETAALRTALAVTHTTRPPALRTASTNDPVFASNWELFEKKKKPTPKPRPIDRYPVFW